MNRGVEHSSTLPFTYVRASRWTNIRWVGAVKKNFFVDGATSHTWRPILFCPGGRLCVCVCGAVADTTLTYPFCSRPRTHSKKRRVGSDDPVSFVAADRGSSAPRDLGDLDGDSVWVPEARRGQSLAWVDTALQGAREVHASYEGSPEGPRPGHARRRGFGVAAGWAASQPQLY